MSIVHHFNIIAEYQLSKNLVSWLSKMLDKRNVQEVTKSNESLLQVRIESVKCKA